MERNSKFLITTIIIIGLLGIIGSYSYYKFREYLIGPQIEVLSPVNGSTLSEALVDIQGLAQNISFITLNNRQIFVDETGKFSEKLLLASGYNIMKIEAKDRFGRIVERTLELIYQDRQTEKMATSTPLRN